jgi:serine/threonine protein kinase
LIRRIGRGANAFVYEVERLTDNKHFAVKTFLKKHTINSLDPQKRLAFINEINIMRSLNNPNIIKLKGMYES